MNEKHEQWLKMSFEERRGRISNFLVDHTFMTVNPTDNHLAEVGKEFYFKDCIYMVIEITKNDAFDWTFIHVIVSEEL